MGLAIWRQPGVLPRTRALTTERWFGSASDGWHSGAGGLRIRWFKLPFSNLVSGKAVSKCTYPHRFFIVLTCTVNFPFRLRAQMSVKPAVIGPTAVMARSISGWATFTAAAWGSR